MNLNIGKTTEGKAFKLPLDLVTQTQAIVATKGRGKTYLAMVQTEEMLEAGQQVVCLDPTGVWWGLRADGTGRGQARSLPQFAGFAAKGPRLVLVAGLAGLLHAGRRADETNL